MKSQELVSGHRDRSGTLVAESRGTVIETSQAPTGGPTT
jgi:hypothetical protein